MNYSVNHNCSVSY